MTRTRCYRKGVLCAENFSLEDVSEHLAEESAVVWVDLLAPKLEELQLVADELGRTRSPSRTLLPLTSDRSSTGTPRMTSSPRMQCSWM